MSVHTHQSIEQAHAYFTECQLATLAHMAMLKSTSKSALGRQRNICINMMGWVNGDAAAKIHRDCPRVLGLLRDKKEFGGIEKAIDAEIERFQSHDKGR